MKHGIKFGVSLYSLSTEFIHEKLDIEGCLKSVHEMGYKGVEIVAAQMVPDYPFPQDNWLYEFKGLLEKYELEPVCWSAYIDMGTRTDRDLNDAEILQCTINDLAYAKKAGFSMVRTQHAISPKIFKQMIPYCKALDMKLTIEMHWPHHPDVEVWKEYFALMKGEGKGYLGFVPDFSIFQQSPHKLYLRQAVDMGCREEKIQELVAKHQAGASLQAALTGDYNEQEKKYGEEIYHKFNAPACIEQLKDVADCIFYVHGKFYYLDEDLNDPCIPHEAIINKLVEYGYKGYIASEFEGHHFYSDVDCVKQLAYYVAMNERIIQQLTSEATT